MSGFQTLPRTSSVTSVLYVRAASLAVLVISQLTRQPIEKTAVAKDWLKRVFSSNKLEFCNFVPPLDDETCKLFVHCFWLLKANDLLKAKELHREARRIRGLEPLHLYAHPHGECLPVEPGGDTVLSAPAVLNQHPYQGVQASGFEVLATPTSSQTFGVGTTTKPLKLPVALRRKQGVSKPTPSVITKRPGAARISFEKKLKSVPKARSTASPAVDKNESSSVSDKGEWEFWYRQGDSFVIRMSMQVSAVRWVSPRSNGRLIGVISTGLPSLPDPKPARALESMSTCPLVPTVISISRMSAVLELETLVLHGYLGTSELRTLGPEKNLVLNRRRLQVVLQLQTFKIDAPLLPQTEL
jgi:hypothetical protein